jgi:transcriptional regulator with XRE-family HTH domain
LKRISVSYVSMLERGQRSPPLETIEALAEALGVRPVALLSAPSRPSARGARGRELVAPARQRG